MAGIVFIVIALTVFAGHAAGQGAPRLVYHGPLGDAMGRVALPEEIALRVYDAQTGGRLVAGPFAPTSLDWHDGEAEATFEPAPDDLLSGAPRWLEASLGLTAQPRVPIETVYYDGVDASGQLTGGIVFLAQAVPAGADAAPAAGVTTILDNGPISNRIDLVFVGDGYLVSELGGYATHVAAALNTLLSQEPFSTYGTFFNAHRVDVISSESGVDNDPTQGISRSTAIDMGFWCEGIERLLCVDVAKAYGFAAQAPQTDHVLAVANSVKYGGAGYTSSDLATYSGGNSSAAEVAIHELGHSLGNLADEYHYGDGATYTGFERPERNISILNSSLMPMFATKWAAWLGNPGVDYDGLVSTYEGAYYNQYRIYRPTFNSKMRSLGRPFNLPSVEGLIIEFYKFVSPLDDWTPTGPPLENSSVVFVNPVHPLNHPLEIQWSLDGIPVAGATQETLHVVTLGLAPGDYILSVMVKDSTTLVHDEPARDSLMTESRSWTLQVAPSAAVRDVDPASALRFAIAPSPFADRTTLRYRLPAVSAVRLSAYDLAGRRVAVLADAIQPGGPHEVALDGRGWPNGLYVFHLETEHGTVVRKALHLR